MDSMRWVLLAIGALLVAGVYVWSRKRAAAEEDFVRHEPAMQGGGHADDEALDPLFAPLPQLRSKSQSVDTPSLQAQTEEPDLQAMQVELSTLQAMLDAEAQEDSAGTARARLVREIPSQPAVSQPQSQVSQAQMEEKLLSLYIVAPPGEVFVGEAVQAALESAGLRYGDMHIYHRYPESRDTDIPIFGVANLIEPGTLEPERLAEQGTPGLTLFLQLPGPLPTLAAFDLFIRTAQQLTQALGGELRDKTRSAFSRQMFDHLRDDLQHYERRRQLHRRA